MRDKIIIAGMLGLLLVGAIAYATSYSTITLTVFCWNGTISLTTDETTYSVVDTANMTVNLTDYMDINLSEYLLLDVYNTSGKVLNMAVDNAIVPANGTNTTSYYNDFDLLETGDYWIRAELVNVSYYPAENRTILDCNANPQISDVNITLLGARPNPPTNLTLILTNNTSGEVTLNWTLSNSTNITNYIIYVIYDYDGFNFSDPYDTVSNTTTNYTDLNSTGYDEIYYIVRANNTLGLTDTNTNTVGKFNIKLYTGWNLIAFPLLLFDYDANNVVYNVEDTDQIWRYDASNPSDPYEKTDYYVGFGWFGDFTQLEVDRGYWYNSKKAGYTTSPFNLTITGEVAKQDRNQTFYSGFNLIGIASVKDWDADTLFTSEVEGDELWRYDASNPSDPYEKTDYYVGFGWFGDFTGLEPGKGYWYNSKNTTTYNWTYTP